LAKLFWCVNKSALASLGSVGRDPLPILVYPEDDAHRLKRLSFTGQERDEWGRLSGLEGEARPDTRESSDSKTLG